MTSRERFKKALEFDRPDRAPRDLWALPGVPLLRKDDLKAVQDKYPNDLAVAPLPLKSTGRAKGDPGQVGVYTDDWGVEWTVAEIGVCGEVKRPILDTEEAVAEWQAPLDMFDLERVDRINAFCENTDRFVMTGGDVRPFERMQFLRGTENVLLDLAMQTETFFSLRDRIHEWNLRFFEIMAKTKVDALYMMDDWGSQASLLISPDLWRELFKPLYKDYTDIAKAHGKYFMMHSDGNIESIYPDLIEIGVNALNSQLFCMDIEGLAAKYKGKIAFYGEIDRQRILPFGTADDVREAVRRVRRALDDGTGGVIAQCEWGNDDPRENIEAVFETWLEDRSAF